MKVSITWDGIHHGTRQGDTESPKYGDLSAVWGEKGPRGKPYLGTLWGNGMSMCMLRDQVYTDLNSEITDLLMICTDLLAY